MLERVEGPVALGASNGEVVSAAGAGFWSVRHQGYIEAPITGRVELWTLSDDGVRVWVDGRKVIDNWNDHDATWNRATLELERGQRLPIRIEYYQRAGGATLQLAWQWDGQPRVPVPREYLWHGDDGAASGAPVASNQNQTAPGLKATYYKNKNLNGGVVAERAEGPLNFNVANGVAVAPQAGDSKWSASYEGYLKAPITGTLQLWTVSDDGVRLWARGQKLIDNWTEHPPAWDEGTINVTKGERLPLRIEYFQNRGESVLQFYWSWNGERNLVPLSALSHASSSPGFPGLDATRDLCHDLSVERFGGELFSGHGLGAGRAQGAGAGGGAGGAGREQRRGGLCGGRGLLERASPGLHRGAHHRARGVVDVV